MRPIASYASTRWEGPWIPEHWICTVTGRINTTWVQYVVYWKPIRGMNA